MTEERLSAVDVALITNNSSIGLSGELVKDSLDAFELLELTFARLDRLLCAEEMFEFFCGNLVDFCHFFLLLGNQSGRCPLFSYASSWLLRSRVV